jgi:hypothetical protein
MLGEETARVLTTARESAAEIRRKAEERAAQLVSEASDEAARLREEAEVEASRRRSDAAADAEAELSMAKQQGREMVNEARAYRERVLSELSRRRELAREQIEQLLHGRDRLIKTFESARLVAVDVIAELEPLGEPDEYVNLAPTTGPVPVMVPNSPRPTQSEAPVVAEEPVVEEPVVEEEPVAEDQSVADAAEEEPAAEEPVAEEEPAAEEPVAEEPVADEPVAQDVDADEFVVEEAAEPVVDVADADEIVESTDESADEVAEPGDVATDRDDVVVDLFARIRAGAADEPADDDVADETPEAEADTDTDADVVDEAPDADADAPTPIPVEAHDHQPVDEMQEPDESAEITAFEQRAADLTPLIVASAKKIKRVLADEQNEVLDALRRQDPVQRVDELLPPPAAHIERYRAAIVDDLLAAAHAGASSVVSGRVARLSKADAAGATALAEAVLGEWLILPLRERLERCVADGGGDNSEVTRRVRAVYREWKTQHIDEQLDDVILTAHGRGAFAAFEPGTPVVWTSDHTRSVCSDCDDNTLSGAVPIGEAFPTGHVCAPAHLGCRCLLVPAER